MSKTLDQEALEVRRGADTVQTQFLRILEVGTPSVSELAYAVKSRIKDDFKIVEKVQRKREEKGIYRVSDLRDILGVRIVTLYRLDALVILPRLLERIKENSGLDEAKLFLGDPIEEIRIYSVNPQGDAQKLASRIEAIFKDLGFGEKCKIHQKSENYTSVHMVLWARGKWNKKYVDVPVEVQLRTALEDVWSEMDHQLKYKRLSVPDDAENAAMMENCLAHLNVMKTLNDGLAQYGDQVKIQIDQLDDSLRRVIRFRLAEEPESRLTPFPLYDGELRKRVRDLLGRSREAFNDREAGVSTRKISALLTADGMIKEFQSRPAHQEWSEEFISELDYVLTMERALLQFEIGNRLGAAGNKHYLESQQLYDRMSQKYPDRAIIQYRIARVLYELGQKEQAKDKVANLIEKFDDFDLPREHWMLAAAYRILGFWSWAEVERAGEGRESPVKEEFLGAVLLAAKCSLQASRLPVSEANQPNEVPHESPRVMALSNLLFFVVEYLESGGEWRSLGDCEITKEVFRQALNEVAQFDEASAADFHKLNTLRRVFLREGDAERARHYASLAIRDLERRGVRDRGGSTVEEHVLRVCSKTVAGL